MLFNKGKEEEMLDIANCTREKNGIKITVKRTEVRMFYDSTWEVTVEINKDGKTESVKTRLIRFDDENAQNLVDEIQKLDSYTVDKIRGLDEKHKIYYD